MLLEVGHNKSCVFKDANLNDNRQIWVKAQDSIQGILKNQHPILWHLKISPFLDTHSMFLPGCCDLVLLSPYKLPQVSGSSPYPRPLTLECLLPRDYIS